MERSYSTYKARLQLANRLRLRRIAWDTVLVAAATSTAMGSLFLAFEKELYGPHGDLIIVSFSLLTLVASIVVSQAAFGARARAAELNYKEIQEISQIAEVLSERSPDSADIDDIQRRYLSSIRWSENHSRSDHILGNAIQSGDDSKSRKYPHVASRVATYGPFFLLVFPVLVMVPPVIWLF